MKKGANVKTVFWNTGMLWLLVSAMNLGAGEVLPEPERVGDLGGEASLAFEGNQTFSQINILRALGMTLDFHAQSHPSAPLADYLAWLQQKTLRGYQQAGFAKAGVTVKADRQAQRIRVRITEGPRFVCGEVRVSGLDKTLAEQLTARLREAAAMPEPMKGTGIPGFGWPWSEGQHVPADPASLAAFERSVLEALTELNHHQAQVHVELALHEGRRQADLLIQVKKPGVLGTLAQIEVTGLKANPRDELLAFLQLRPGMALAGNVTNDAVRRLWDSARFRWQEAKLSPLAEPGRFKLDIAVVEYTNAPPLKQEFTAEEQAFLRLRDWVMQWKNRAEDWVLELEAGWEGHRGSAEVILDKRAWQSWAGNRLPPTSPNFPTPWWRLPDWSGFIPARSRAS